MSAKPNQTLITALDEKDYLWGLLCKRRGCRIENDFEFGYDTALNDVMYRLLYASLEPESTCAECAVERQRLTTMDDVLAYLFVALRDHKLCALENEFDLGYESALNDLIDQVRAALPPESPFALNAPDDNQETRMTNGDKLDELIEIAIRGLAAKGLICETGERRWSERTQSYQIVWRATKDKQH